MRAWLHALSNEPQARQRLAETTLEGADPWVRTAVIRNWKSGVSISLHEAVMQARSNLGKEEAVARLELLAARSRPAETPQEKRVLCRLVRLGIGDHFPVKLLNEWADLHGNPRSWEGLLPLITERAIAQSTWGSEALQWAHRTIAPIQNWPSILLDVLERAEDPVIRDAYWALHREPEPKPRVAFPGRR